MQEKIERQRGDRQGKIVHARECETENEAKKSMLKSVRQRNEAIR